MNKDESTYGADEKTNENESNATAHPPQSSSFGQDEEAHRHAGNSTENSGQDSQRQNPMDVINKTLARAWFFIIEPKHSNALVAVFTILIFVVGFCYSVVALLQWCAMRESNRINRASLESVQRAFVTFTRIGAIVIGPSKPMPKRQWWLSAEVENSGTTPAINNIKRFTGSNTLNAEPSEDEFLGTVKDRTIAGEIGPKAQDRIGLQVEDDKFFLGNYTWQSIATNAFKKFFASRRTFFWGWIGYRDIFSPHTKAHVTEFCQEIAVVYFEGSTIGAVANFQTKECSEHNCTDQHCKDYEAISKLVPE